jgi:hypothetical protein
VIGENHCQRRTEVVKSGNTANRICFRGLQALAMHGVSCVTKRYRTVPCFSICFRSHLETTHPEYIIREGFFKHGESIVNMATITDYEITAVGSYKVSCRLVLADDARTIPIH